VRNAPITLNESDRIESDRIESEGVEYMAYGNYRSERDREREERWRTRDRKQDPREQDPREQDPGEQYTQRDDDDSRLGRESMARDEYGGAEYSGRGGYLSLDRQDQGSRFERGDDSDGEDPDPGRRDMGARSDSPSGEGGEGERSSESARHESGHEGRHYGNRSGGWPGRENEQWRNRDTHGRYDRDANHGGFSTRTGDDAGYGEGGSSRGGESQRPQRTQDQGAQPDDRPEERGGVSDTQNAAPVKGKGSKSRH